MALLELRVDLLDRLEPDPDHNEDRGAAEGQVLGHTVTRLMTYLR